MSRIGLVVSLVALASADAQAVDVRVSSARSDVAAHPSVNVVPGGPGQVVVGGGAQVHWSGAGSLLTATAPVRTGARVTGWQAAAKDHLRSSPAAVSAYVVTIDNPAPRYEVQTFESTSALAPHPTTVARLPAGWVLLGGGCVDNWRARDPRASGNMLTASFPSDARSWTCSGKDHTASSPSTVTAFVIGIRPIGSDPAPVSTICRETSPVSAAPTAIATNCTGNPRARLTGGGATTSRTVPGGANHGQLITASFPAPADREPAAGEGFTNPSRWIARSKDHVSSDPMSVTAHSVWVDFRD